VERSKRFLLISLMPGYRKRVLENLSVPMRRLPTEIVSLISMLLFGNGSFRERSITAFGEDRMRRVPHLPGS
jgi:hypothetical protein